jgi:Major Facilitator Superfamily
MNAAMTAAAPIRVDRRLFITLPIALVGVQVVAGGVDLLLAAALDQLERGSGSVTTFGVITGVASLVALMVYPLAGMGSDRTSPRLGRRSAWVVAGALGSACGLVLLAGANGSTGLGVGYIVAVAFVPVIVVPLYASIADRVAVPSRGMIGALVGAATIAGGMAGNVLAAGFATRIALGAATFALIMLGGAAAFALLGGETRTEGSAPADGLMAARNPDAVRASADLRTADFAWFTIGRFAVFLAYALVVALAYYVVRDYIGSREPAGGVATFAVVTGTATLVTALVAGPWSDRIQRRKPFVVVAAALLAVGAVLPAASPTMSTFLLAAAVIGVGFGTYMAVGTALGTMVLPNEAAVGRDIGLIGLANASAAAIAPFLGSQVAATFGYPAVFGLASMAAIGGLLALLRIRSVR